MKNARKISAIAERVMFLVRELAGGSQRKFGEMIGCSPMTLSRIATGRCDVGGKILHLIGGLPQVNDDWLRHGTGSPFMRVRPKIAESVPLVERLVPGIISDYPSFWTDRGVYLAPVHCNGTSYAIEAGSAMPSAWDAERMLNNDLLIIDGDEARWREKSTDLKGRLVVVKRNEVAEMHRVNVGASVTTSPLSNSRTKHSTDSIGSRPPRAIDLPEFDTSPESESEAESPPTQIDKNDFPVENHGIVGIVVQLLRTM